MEIICPHCSKIIDYQSDDLILKTREVCSLDEKGNEQCESEIISIEVTCPHCKRLVNVSNRG